jgi:ribonuclease HI
VVDGVWNLIAGSDIPVAGAFIGEYLGRVIPASQLTLHADSTLALPFAKARTKEYGTTTIPTFITTLRSGGNTRFISHSCDPNCKPQIWWVNGHPRLGIFSLHGIKEGEAFSVNYREGTEDSALAAALGPKENCTCTACAPGRDTRGHLAAYTDGSHDPKAPRSTAGWGVVFVERPKSRRGVIADKEFGTILAELHGPVVIEQDNPAYLGAHIHSNNTAEMTAIGEALLHFRQHTDRNYLNIYTDSAICIGLVYGTSTAKDNHRLVATVKQLFQELSDHVTISKVKAHSRITFNEKADLLADRGRTSTC